MLAGASVIATCVGRPRSPVIVQEGIHMKALHLGLAAALIGGTAMAQAPSSNGTVYIAPGNPATVGRSGAVVGVVPGEATPAPRGSMSTFGGKFGTEGPRNEVNTNSPAQPAVTTSDANRKTSAAPVHGANSFTMTEARRRIEAGGFAQVTALQKDRDGVWRGKAMRNGAPVSVYCDYQGNVGAS